MFFVPSGDNSLHRYSFLGTREKGPAVMQIVTKYFKRLDSLAETFRDYLWTLSRHLLDLVKENQGSVVVRLVKIVDTEERADERVLASEQIRSSNPALSEAGKFKVLAENPRAIKNYRSQMFNAIHESITEMFYKRLASQEEDAQAALEVARFVFEDLALISDELVPRFPSKYKIFPFFVLQYHKHVYDLCNRVISRNLETREILYMTSWIRDYYHVMGERMGVGEELLEPRLLDDNESSLTQEYIKLIKSKLVEWVNRLADSEANEFIARDKPPDSGIPRQDTINFAHWSPPFRIDSENMYGTAAAVILFQMINQQIDIAADAARGGQLLLDVTVECLRIMQYFQDLQLKVMDMEANKFHHGGDDVPGGFPEYVIAWCNNHLRCTEFMEALQKRLESQLDEKYRAECSKHLSATLDGFMKVSKRGSKILLDIVFRDVSPVFQQLHTSVWYEQQLMATITTTLDDYFQDFKKHLLDYLFSKLSSDAMDKFLMHYVESMRGKAVKFRMPTAVSQMKVDLAASIRFWSEFKTTKRVKQSFDIVDKVIGLLESSSTMIFLSWYSMWKVYNDVPMAFVEDLLYKRDDLDKSSIKEAMANCKTKAKEGNPESVPSIFTKISEASRDNK